MKDQVWEEAYLSTCIFIICGGAMNTYLKEHYLLTKHNGKFRSFVNIIDPNTDNDANVNKTVTINHSSYYNYDNLVTTLKRNKNQFSNFSSNILSIKAKLNELKICIETLKQSHLEFSAICIQENWIA